MPLSTVTPDLCSHCANYDDGACPHLAFIREATGLRKPVFQFCPVYESAPAAEVAANSTVTEAKAAQQKESN